MEWTIQIVTPDLPKAPQTPYTKDMNNETNFNRFSFASLAARAGQAPADYATDMNGGDFDDYFTAEDIDRRRYETERRRARYGY